MQAVSRALSRTVVASHHFLVTHSGVAMRLSPGEADLVRSLPAVVAVEREWVVRPSTYRSPMFIGADRIWNGSATQDGLPYQGLNMVAAVLDSGLDAENPSFANDPHCGHGEGGIPDKVLSVLDCGSTDASGMCNGPGDGGDFYSHGSHVAGILAGNRIDDTADPSPAIPGLFLEISGVAPCAHIRSYRVCPGNCPAAWVQAGMNSVLLHGDVDVMNFSLSGGENPWVDHERRKLDLVDAGVFVAAAAGNTSQSLTDPVGRVIHRGPWVMSVAASTLDTSISGAPAQGDVLTSFSLRGPTPAPLADLQKPDITGPGLNIYAALVGYMISVTGPGTPPSLLQRVPMSRGTDSPAGSLLSDHPLRFDPSQPWEAEGCDPGFPANHFDGAAALVRRGTCSFTEKIANAFSAGAALVLVWNNVAGPFTMSTPGQPDIPAFSISGIDGERFRNFVQANPAATIYYRGRPDSQFNFWSGTSMSSPHVSAAALLVRQAHPTWTPSEVKSALQMTAVRDGFKDDGITPWDWDDVGSGRVDLRVAALAGLVMDEVFENYLAADPAVGGDVKTLNTPSVRNLACLPGCSFTRTVRSTRNESTDWTIQATIPGFNISVVPESFTLADSSSTQTLEITAAPQAGESGSMRRFGVVELIPTTDVTRGNPAIPAAHITVVLRAAEPGAEIFRDGFE